MPERVWKALFALLVLVFVARIASTYRVFTNTIDENDHIEAGIEYFQRGVYEYEPQHPPLARIVEAALPYFLADLRLTEARIDNGKLVHKPIDEKKQRLETFLWGGMWREGSPEYYWRTLSLARAGNLVFGLLLLWVVYAWAAELFGRRTGAIAALLASCSPTILAHSGLATLDAAAAATTAAASYAFWRWSRGPSLRSAAIAGAATAIAVTSKLSTVAFLPPIFLSLFLLARRALARKQALRELGAFLAVVATLIWAVYRFDFGPIGELDPTFAQSIGASSDSWILTTPLPAPSFFQGLLDVAGHNEQGHSSYLLGEWSKEGRAAYFPVALAVKTTLPLLALAIWGFVAGWRSGKKNETLSAAAPIAAVMLIAVPANINIGIRHILPLFPSLAILAAIPFARASFGLDKKNTAGIFAALLLVWHVGESVGAHPDYLPYFNQLGRGRETAVLLDSNLDWGQDLARLGDWMQHEGSPTTVILRYFGEARADTFGINTYLLPPAHPDAGYFAVSANYLFGLEGSSDRLRALQNQEPLAKIGRSIFIFRIPPNDVFQLAPPWFFESYEELGKPVENGE